MKNQIKLSLSFDEAKLLHNGASQERKLELEEFFPELNPQPITDRVKDYEDALEVLRRDHFDEKNLYPREIARRMLETIIEALNEGWKPNLSNRQEYNCWYCYFNRSPAGANTNLGVRLCLKSKELADYVGSNFKNLYEEMLLG